jgi:drug/metabolite transporter (DMT)-like permease
MRALQILGVVLIAGGLFCIIRPPSYPHEESVFKVGGIEAKLQERRPLPAWVGGALLGAGCVLVVVGLKRSA